MTKSPAPLATVTDAHPQFAPVFNEAELAPLLSKGELLVDNWWEAPHVRRQSFVKRHWLFILTVVIPVALTGIYLWAIAADQYISEARFVVRTSSRSDAGSLTSMIQSQKMSRANDETYAVNEYLTSRAALDSLVQKHQLLDILSRPEADLINRFPNFYSKDNKEYLYRHFKRMVDAEIDTESGISTLTVRAFRPDDAQALAQALLRDGENLVNRLNRRAYEDGLRYANMVVEEARQHLGIVEDRLTTFRNEAKVIDPSREVAATLDGLGKIITDLVQSQAQLTQQIVLTPTGPAVAPLRERVNALTIEVRKQREQLAGDNQSMATKLATFEKLMIERQLAAKGLELAVIHLGSARQDSQQQQLYLETIVEPGAPDQSLYPRRILIFLIVSAIAFAFFSVSRMFIYNVMEHH